MSSKDDLEIERKFLLKNFPFERTGEEMKEVEMFTIHQCYVVRGKGEIHRYRSELFHGIRDTPYKYYHTVKELISPGVFKEVEKEISHREYMRNFRKDCIRTISKYRYKHKENDLVWEIDVYLNMKLITVEVELEDINQEIEMPKKIQEQLIFELTGIEEFSNFNLADENIT